MRNVFSLISFVAGYVAKRCLVMTSDELLATRAVNVLSLDGSNLN
jgi:hypothetical protein